jgi:methylmalonyl-CoA/ethylmalonyl-CoA epimerase
MIMIKVNGLEHVSWASEDLEQPRSLLGLFGFAPTGREDIPEQHVTANYFGSDCGLRFEVIQPIGADSQLRRFLEQRGAGLHHVCLEVEDLEDACAQVARAGGQLVGEIFSDSRGRHAFVHPKSTGGVLIGMVELHPQLKKGQEEGNDRWPASR